MQYFFRVTLLFLLKIQLENFLTHWSQPLWHTKTNWNKKYVISLFDIGNIKFLTNVRNLEGQSCHASLFGVAGGTLTGKQGIQSQRNNYFKSLFI